MPGKTPPSTAPANVLLRRLLPPRLPLLALPAPRAALLIDIKIDSHVIDYVVDCVSETVNYAMGRPHTSPRTHPSPYLTKFTAFARTVLSRAEVTPPTLLVALVYIARARPHLSIALEQWALERVFLGALIVASKYTNDSTLKNVHWALCTGVFGKRDVGRIEREFLDVLDWELGVGEADARTTRTSPRAKPLLASRSRSRLAVRPTPPAHTHLAPPPHRTHTHVRRPSMPELEPSSPQSSLASMSPRTPYSARQGFEDVRMDVDASPVKQASGGKFHELLRSFPLPRQAHAPTGRGYRVDA
ncbi:hypothetical protein B0H14DRAFT_3885154 [Mycena olivaceomarginata]|nr:hypothetical protein B0H14DRAFT_3885154 [Mycena olivaceomarginata]